MILIRDITSVPHINSFTYSISLACLIFMVGPTLEVILQAIILVIHSLMARTVMGVIRSSAHRS